MFNKVFNNWLKYEYEAIKGDISRVSFGAKNDGV